MKCNLSVKQLSLYIKNVFEDELFLQNVTVVGEVFEASMGGKYVFLTLKEDDVTLPCICFKRIILPKIGDKVMLHGSVNFTVKSAKVSFLFDSCVNIGEGLYQAEFLKLKNKLYGLGYFDKKTPLPSFITNVCIITSSRGSVVHDFLSGIQNGHSYISVDVISSAVQGENATSEIVSAIKRADKCSYDVIVIARGGGSASDLECFNKEELATAVANAKTPIISAVGHETDYTLSDFCASYRAGTPSFAAKIITENNQMLISKFATLSQRATSLIDNLARKKANQVASAINKISVSAVNNISKADYLLYDRYLKMSTLLEQKVTAISNDLKEKNARSLNILKDKCQARELNIAEVSTKLNYLNPLKTLSLGYAKVVCGEQTVSSVMQVNEGDEVSVLLSDGKLLASVTEKESF